MVADSAQTFVTDKINQRKVMLFSKTHCPYSKLVKKLLAEYNLPNDVYESTDIESRQDVNQIENYFQIICLTDARELPQLFVDGKAIGGWKEIMWAFESGELRHTIRSTIKQEIAEPRSEMTDESSQ